MGNDALVESASGASVIGQEMAMRLLLGVLMSLVFVGCGSSAPTPIIVFVTPAPAASVPPPTVQPTQAPPTPTATPDTSILVDVVPVAPKVTGASKVDRYEVSGSTPQELVGAVLDKCPSWACVAGGVGYGYSVRTIGSSCVGTISKASTTYKPVASLPAWKSSEKVHPELLGWWNDVVKHIASDEARTIKLEKAQNAKLVSQLNGSACSKDKLTIAKWKQKKDRAVNALYDEIASWQVPTYTGP